MTSLAVALMIGVAALMTNEAPVKGAKAITADAPPAPVPSPVPAMAGPSSERVLSLVLALEALRAAPAALDPQNVGVRCAGSGFDLRPSRG